MKLGRDLPPLQPILDIFQHYQDYCSLLFLIPELQVEHAKELPHPENRGLNESYKKAFQYAARHTKLPTDVSTGTGKKLPNPSKRPSGR